MKIKSNLTLRKIADEYIMLLNDGKALDYTKAISLNETAAYLVEAVGQDSFDTARWAELLLEQYELDADTAHRDAQRFADMLIEAGVIEA